MYIRRKVFSNIQVNESEVKTFSTTEYEFDENLEARIFSNDETKEKIKKAAKVGGITTGTAVGAGAAGIYGAKGLGKLVEKEGIKAMKKATTTKDMAKADKAILTGLKMQKAADVINKKVAAGAQGVAEKGKAAGEWAKNTKAGKFTAKKAEKLAKLIADNPKAIKGIKIGGIATAGAAAAAGAGYGGYKAVQAYKNKKANKK